MNARKRKKALIESYGGGRIMPVRQELEWRRSRIEGAKRGFCAPYPFLVPGLRRPAK